MGILKRAKKFIPVLSFLVVAPLMFSNHSFAQSKAESNLKFSISGYQLIGYHGGGENSIPFSLSVFGGERLANFGDAGIFLQYIFPQDQFSSGYMAGVVVAPYIFNLSWGRLLWKNRVGYGRYGQSGGVNLSTGFQFEPGSFIHFRLDILTRFSTVSETASSIPTSMMLGAGFNF